MRTVATKQEPIRLTYLEGSRQVIVMPKDEDNFATTVDAVVKICAEAHKAPASFIRQLRRLLSLLANWVAAHRNDVYKAFLTVRDQGFLFLVVRKGSEYDSEFEDALTDLDLSIARDENFNLIHLSVLALPKVSREACQSFLVSQFIVEFPDAK